MTDRLVILGAGGEGRVAAAAAHAAANAGADFVVEGFLDDGLVPGQIIQDLPVLGRLADWSALPPDTVFIPALHKVGDMQARSARIKSLEIPRKRWARIVHPQSFIAPDVTLGCGVFISSFVSILPGTRIGDFATVRAGVSLGHDTVVGDFAFIGLNSALAGWCSVGECAHVAPSACVREHIAIGDFAIVGLGAVVVKPVAAHDVVAGNPARPMPQR